MSDLNAVLSILAVFLGGAATSHLWWNRINRLCDTIATGTAEGGSVTVRYRFLRLYNDYLTGGFGVSFILLVLAVGFYAAAGLVDSSDVRAVAYFCSAVSGASGIANLILVIGWVLYLGSVLRQAEAD